MHTVKQGAEPISEVLIVDDDSVALKTISSILSENRYLTHAFQTPDEAELLLASRYIPIVLLDLHLTGISGIDVLGKWKNRFPHTAIIFCSGETNISRALECLREGAADYIVKPFSKRDLLFIVGRTLEKQTHQKQAEKFKGLTQPLPAPFIAKSTVMHELRRKIRQLQGYHHLNILIVGESGTGKEVIARLLNQQERRHRPFIAINMAALPAHLVEAELFGVEKGAYTDSKASRPGKFELADEGDLFLDEIGELPNEIQPKILRVIQERTIERVGSSLQRSISFRVISATNRSLNHLKESGTFRHDLLYRLSDIILQVPPLREHKSDIPILVEHFISKYSNPKSCFKKMSDKVLDQLLSYDWPGNIRELESTIKRAMVFNEGPLIESVEIYDSTFFGTSGTELGLRQPQEPVYESIEDCERHLVESALARHGGNRKAAMSELKMSRSTFYRKLSRLGIRLNHN
ncbi:MAG: sigma-54-dependent Fis family transcriptional regulator [Deltaproteobacteria bacterium]|nr:sigma-54-dependent Fis family transcriptional regulator [Deltaproteobacteria bacterium]